ncbi:MAG TPA: glycosyltransferase family 2 protein [Chthoniobacterales bacterium]
MKVSVILPTYNEARNIVALVKEIQRNIPPPWECETIVVDDNSPDGTYSLCQKAFADDPSVREILRDSERGLARSIRTGLERATGDYVLVMDTDFTHRPDEIPLMLHVAAKVDLVSGSRFCPGGRMDNTAHYIASFIFNLFIRVAIRTQVQDNLGGFWVARMDAIRSLPFDRIFFGYGDYYFRMIHYLQHAGRKIVELPAHYCERAAGKSKSRFTTLLFEYSGAVITFAFRPRHGGQ